MDALWEHQILLVEFCTLWVKWGDMQVLHILTGIPIFLKVCQSTSLLLQKWYVDVFGVPDFQSCILLPLDISCFGPWFKYDT